MDNRQKEFFVVLGVILAVATIISYLPATKDERERSPTAYAINTKMQGAEKISKEQLIFTSGKDMSQHREFVEALKTHAKKMRR